ncbi:MAG: class IV adenylate cyclase [Anaerolineae bacterium]|nr:class IV adenylate cyclase [Anaerolineae bacterium]
MAFEVELKARLSQPQEIEAKAASLGVLKGETLKEDIYFRRRGDTAPVPAERFRLRREAGRSVVTFKQLVEAGGVEVNDEVEFGVDDAHAFFQFVHEFGFEPFVVKRKKSRVYRVERASVEFNEVDHLGHFIEIEILCDDEKLVPVARTEVARLYHNLGLTAEAIEPRRYIELLQAAYPVRYRFVNDRNLDWPFVEV